MTARRSNPTGRRCPSAPAPRGQVAPGSGTVFVVDDDPALGEALRWLLEGEGLTVETFTSARHFLQTYNPEQPGALILDVRMPEMSGLELQEHLRERGYAIPIIILTGHGDVPMAVRALKAGALEFLQKPVSDEVLLERIGRAVRLDARRREVRRRHALITARLATLTRREHEVLGLVVAGKANKQIASELSVSEKTIEVHRKHVMKKMGASSAVQLVRMVLAVRQVGA